MIRTDQKGRWQLTAECSFRFKTKHEMDNFAHKNAIKIIEVFKFKRGQCYRMCIVGWGKSIRVR